MTFRDSKMSEIPIDPNSVKIISPVMYYNDPSDSAGARLSEAALRRLVRKLVLS